MSSDTNLLPGITSVINMADSAEKDSFINLMNVKEEPSEVADGLDAQEKVVCVSLPVSPIDVTAGSVTRLSTLFDLSS
jgi:hypothetical protein